MQTKRLGNSDLEITPVGFGAWVEGVIGAAEWRLSPGEISEIEGSDAA